MKKIIAGFFFASCIATVPAAQADINVNIGIGNIPSVNISDNVSVVLMPDTPDIYFMADTTEDVFLWNGMWWRSYQGQWFSSENNNNGWQPFKGTPEFYHKVNPNWKQNYKSGKWNGKPWKYEKVPQGQIKKEHRKDKKNKPQGEGKEKGHKNR
jgi:hypothetical protein